MNSIHNDCCANQDVTQSQEGGGGGGSDRQENETATGPHPENFFPKRTSDTREIDLVPQLGVTRAELVRIRREHLTEVEDWYYTAKRPKVVMLTEKGLGRVMLILGAQLQAVARPAPPAPLELRNAWFNDAQVPRIPANGLILTKGRPGWWTREEAIVKQTAFANRKAIYVEWRGKPTICRVKDAGGFVVGQVIPVREYGSILLAARQPRWPGKW